MLWDLGKGLWILTKVYPSSYKAGKLGAKTVESPVEQNQLQPDSSDVVHDTG